MRNVGLGIGKLALRIEVDDLTRPEVIGLISEHLSNMHQWSPPGTVYAFDVSKLRSPDVTFWTAWDGDELAGCGALKELSAAHGEIKSMRTPTARRRCGAGRAILSHIIEVARNRGYERLSLETGRHDAFLPAQTLYRAFGFEYCGPFGSYGDNGNSIFMTLSLESSP
jgi:putative acetyltransferase